MKFIKVLISASALVAIGAHAQQGQGLSIGASLGATRLQTDQTLAGGGGIDKSSNGGKIYGGYQFAPNVGIELGYADLGKFDTSLGSVRGRGVYLDALGSFPVGQSFSILGRIGAFNAHLNDSVYGNKSGTNLKVGLGVQYDFNQRTGLRAEWERYKFKGVNENPTADLYSIGVNYKF